MTRLVVATTNQGKLREIADLLGDLNIKVLSLADFPCIVNLDEPFGTFAENAVHKALTVARTAGETAVADDSGLVVDALGGLPGVKSARIASSDPERIAWLLEQLRHVPLERRTARFVCALALATPDGHVQQWEEAVEGLITLAPRGPHGFGYDPVFLYPPAGKTFGEMTQAEKSAVSHRGKALRQLRQAIRDTQ